MNIVMKNHTDIEDILLVKIYKKKILFFISIVINNQILSPNKGLQ